MGKIQYDRARGEFNLPIGSPTWFTLSDRAVVSEGEFLSVDDAIWRLIEETSVVQHAIALTEEDPKFYITVFRCWTGLGDDRFSCAGIREVAEPKEELGLKSVFIIQDYLCVALCDTEIIGVDMLEAAIAPQA
ncbi:MAG TPA: hypothetical protein V6D33_12665 [Cyanophyceae cyanobacterium]